MHFDGLVSVVMVRVVHLMGSVFSLNNFRLSVPTVECCLRPTDDGLWAVNLMKCYSYFWFV